MMFVAHMDDETLFGYVTYDYLNNDPQSWLVVCVTGGTVDSTNRFSGRFPKSMYHVTRLKN